MSGRPRTIASLFALLIVAITAWTCAPALPQAPRPSPPQTDTSTPQENARPCPPNPATPLAVWVDDLEVGRELRAQLPQPATGATVSVSIKFIRYLVDDIPHDEFTASATRTDPGGVVSDACYATIVPPRYTVSRLERDNGEWNRWFAAGALPVQRDQVAAQRLHHEATAVGTPLDALVSDWFAGRLPNTVRYQIPPYPQPITLRFSKEAVVYPEAPDRAPMTVVRVTKDHGNQVVFRALLDASGTIREERYPTLHERRLPLSSLSLEPPTFVPWRKGLRSTTYVGYPDQVTKAIYEIRKLRGTVRKRDFDFLDAPANQQLAQTSPSVLTLVVHKGAPDGNTPPTPEDVAPAEFIESDHPAIRDALTYLESRGKRGALPPLRRDLVDPLFTGEFPPASQDVLTTAHTIASYVHTLLPEKLHTHTMFSAVTALMAGKGDCTEHSVLFAAMMRAKQIPTRLVSGMYLIRNGRWVYHMWNEFWDGEHWRAIDVAIGPTMDPPAHYVAVGRGVSDFNQHRHLLAFFLNRTATGIQCNLVSAYADGETLYLSQAPQTSLSSWDRIMATLLFDARRGDYETAYRRAVSQPHPESAPLQFALLVAELAHRTGRWQECERRIDSLLQTTSLPRNVLLLRDLAVRNAIGRKDWSAAAERLSQLQRTFPSFPIAAAYGAYLAAANGDFSPVRQLLTRSDVQDDPHILRILVRAATDFAPAASQTLLTALRTAVFERLHRACYSDFDLLTAFASLTRWTDPPATAGAAAALAALTHPADHHLMRLATCPGSPVPPSPL